MANSRQKVSVQLDKPDAASGVGRVVITSMGSFGFYRWQCNDTEEPTLSDFVSKVLAGLENGDAYEPGWTPDGFDRVLTPGGWVQAPLPF